MEHVLIRSFTLTFTPEEDTDPLAFMLEYPSVFPPVVLGSWVPDILHPDLLLGATVIFDDCTPQLIALTPRN